MSRPKRIVVAHGDARARHMIAWVLRRDGHEVVEASNGAEVVTLLATLAIHSERLPDLLVMAERLRGWTGMDLLTGLQGSEWAVPCVIVAHAGESRTCDAALDHGARAAVEWPSDLLRMRDTVRDAMRSRRATHASEHPHRHDRHSGSNVRA